MKWSTLFHKIGKQPLRVTQHQNVYAILYDKKSHQYVKRYLCLKFDEQGRPYLVEEFRDEFDNQPTRHNNYKAKAGK